MSDMSILHIVAIAYLAAIALDEIDFPKITRTHRLKAFQCIAMSLGDGLICTDSNGLVTVSIRSARAMFGLEADRNYWTSPQEYLRAHWRPVSAGSIINLRFCRESYGRHRWQADGNVRCC